MIYDCFTFFNELDLLEIRLHTLKDVVDKFVIAEATRTHTGKSKNLVFAENRMRFSEFEDKIIYIRVDDLLSEEEVVKDIYNLPWVNENRQRNALIKGLVNAGDNDILVSPPPMQMRKQYAIVMHSAINCSSRLTCARR